MQNPLLSINSISFNYPYQKPLLKDISFTIYRGQFIAIMGPNGAGKSTLIKLLVGLLKPTKGTISIMNTNQREFKDWAKIGYLSQKATSFNTSFPATVEEVVAAPVLANSFLPLSSPTIKAQIREALSLVGLVKEEKSLIGSLSGGQQQRVFLARTLIKKPTLLILDEPFVGIDEYSQQAIFNTLQKLHKKGTTILMVSHNLTLLDRKIDCIFIVKDGGLEIRSGSNLSISHQYHNNSFEK